MTTDLAPTLDELLLETLDFPITCEAGKLFTRTAPTTPCTNTAEALAACRTTNCAVSLPLCHEHVDELLEITQINCLTCGRRGPVHTVVNFLPIGGHP